MKTLITFLFLITFSALIAACQNEVAFTPGANNPFADPPIPLPIVVPEDYELETFIQKGSRKKVDIMFVVDNSQSMSKDQKKLGGKLNNFIDQLQDVDWQIAITTTDVSDGIHGVKGEFLNFPYINHYIINRQTPNHEALFLDTVVREESSCAVTSCASGDERPLQASILAMEKRDNENAGFFRDGSDLALVVLTDEDEGSSGRSIIKNAKDVTNYFNAHLMKDSNGEYRKFKTYGIGIIPGDSNCFAEQDTEAAAYYATHLADLVNATNGIMGSICDDDFGPTLEMIGKNVRTLLDHVVLSKEPIEDTVSVVLVPADPNVKWVVEGKQISFNPPPAPGTQIHVAYKAY